MKSTLRVASILLATCVAGFAGFAAFALLADNGAMIFARLPGILALLVFAGTATVAAIVAIRGLRTFTRRGPA
jgi:hypothetical protein